jgi:hypothetical protein
MKNHLGRDDRRHPGPEQEAGRVHRRRHEILAALATQAAVSIDNSRLFLSVIQKNMQLVDTKEQLEHRVRDLKLLFELESAMGRATSLEELFVAVLGEAMRSCEARAGPSPCAIPITRAALSPHRRREAAPIGRRAKRAAASVASR